MWTISSASSTSSIFLNYLVVLKKLSNEFYPIEIFTMIFSCLKIPMYSTNTSFSCCLGLIILASYSVNDRYWYVAHIGLWIDWEMAPIRFKGWLRILSYLGCSLIKFCIWHVQNSLNITAYTFLNLYSSFLSRLTWF